MDFHSFYLHSKHESAVVGIDITADGRKALGPALCGSRGCGSGEFSGEKNACNRWNQMEPCREMWCIRIVAG